MQTRKRHPCRGGASGVPALFPRRAPRQALTWLPSAPPSCGSETNAWLGAAAAEVRRGARWGRSWGGHGLVIVGVEECSAAAAEGGVWSGGPGSVFRGPGGRPDRIGAPLSPASPTAAWPSPTPRPLRLAARRGPQPGSPAGTPALLQEARFPAVPLCASPRFYGPGAWDREAGLGGTHRVSLLEGRPVASDVAWALGLGKLRLR